MGLSLYVAHLYAETGGQEQTRSLSTSALYDKKNASDEVVFVYEDESHIRDYQVLRATWSPKGKQKQVPTYGHHATVSLFGCVEIQNGEFLCMETDKCDAQAFLAFLHYVVSQYEGQHVVIVLDNARIHHAKLLQTFLKENEHCLTLLFLPPYSQNLNAVERIWGWLKKSVIANRFHATCEAIGTSIVSFLEHLHAYPEKVLRLLGSMAMSEN
jgi:transposase